MRRFVLYILVSSISFALKAQNLPTPTLQKHIEGFIGQEIFMQQAVDGSNLSNSIQKVLAQKILSTYPTATTLHLSYTKTSPSGTYYTYILRYNNTPVFSSSLKVFLDKNNIIRWAHHNFAPFSAPASAAFLNTTEIENFAKTKFPKAKLLASESTWVNNGKTLLPSFAITLKETNKQLTNQYIYNANGTLLYINPLDKHFTAADTPTYGYVFNPDPLTTAQVAYGGAYSDSIYKGTDSSTVDSKQLIAQRQKVQFRGTLQGDSILLANNDFFISEVSAPSWPVTSVTLGDTFNFVRSQYQFADVNAYYHLNAHLSYVRKLGFNNLPGFRIKVDAHALSGQDASRFTASDNPPTLQFGDGGIPDAEDADVVVHEFGHALSHGASPNTSIGLERRALDEAFGDYFAASYSWNISTYNWRKVFSWDGNNGGWQGRSVDYNGSYNQLSNNIWTDGQLWSTALMRLLRIIGRDKTDALQLEALYRLNANMSMRQLANAVQQIDTLQNNGDNFEPIQCVFASVDILDSLSNCQILGVENVTQTPQQIFKVYNSWGFAQKAEDAEIYFSHPATYQLTIFDATGKQIVNETLQGVAHKKIQGQNFAPGIYILKVREKSTGKAQVAKLLRY
jgi:hypothetical protein